MTREQANKFKKGQHVKIAYNCDITGEIVTILDIHMSNPRHYSVITTRPFGKGTYSWGCYDSLESVKNDIPEISIF